MAFWLFKEEPGCYSFADLERDGSTTWSGVTNALAQNSPPGIKKGDRILFYHTGEEKAVVGVMEAVGRRQTRTRTTRRASACVVDVKPVRKLKNPVTLAAIKADKAFADWELVRIGRLSVMPVPAALWKKIEKMSENWSAGRLAAEPCGRDGPLPEKVNPREIPPGVRMWVAGLTDHP